MKAGDTVTVLSRNSLLASAPRAGLAGCSVLRIHSRIGRSSAHPWDSGPRGPGGAGSPAAGRRHLLVAARPPSSRLGHQGLTARIDIDNRYQSSPLTLIKRLVSIVACSRSSQPSAHWHFLDRRSATVRAAHEEAVTDGELHHRTGFRLAAAPTVRPGRHRRTAGLGAARRGRA